MHIYILPVATLAQASSGPCHRAMAGAFPGSDGDGMRSCIRPAGSPPPLVCGAVEGTSWPKRSVTVFLCPLGQMSQKRRQLLAEGLQRMCGRNCVAEEPQELVDCTHIVVAENVTRTKWNAWKVGLKLDLPSFDGKPVVMARWLTACLSAGRLVPEEEHMLPQRDPSPQRAEQARRAGAPQTDERALKSESRRRSRSRSIGAAKETGSANRRAEGFENLMDLVLSRFKRNKVLIESLQGKARKEWVDAMKTDLAALQANLEADGLRPGSFDAHSSQMRRAFDRDPFFAGWGPRELKEHNEKIRDARKGLTLHAHWSASSWTATELTCYVRTIAKCSWEELLSNRGVARSAGKPAMVDTADLDLILKERWDVSSALEMVSWKTESTRAELRDKLAIYQVRDGLAGLGADGQKEAVSRIAIDHILSLVCRRSKATLSLEEWLGDPETRVFPSAVCDYVMRNSSGKVAAIIEAKRCKAGADVSLLSCGVVQVALQSLQAQYDGMMAKKHVGVVTDGRRWALLSPTQRWFALTPVLDLLEDGAEAVLRCVLSELLE